MSENFQQIVLRELHRLVEPLINATNDDEVRDQLFLGIGWDLSQINPGTVTGLQAKFTAINNAYSLVFAWITTPPQTFADLLDALDDAKILIDAIHDFKTAPQISLADFDKLGRDITNLLLGEYLSVHQPVLFNIFLVLGLVEAKDEKVISDDDYIFDTASPYNIVRVPFQNNKLELNKITQLFSNPNYFALEYSLPSGSNWLTTTGAATNDAKTTARKLFPRLAKLFGSLGIRSMSGYDVDHGMDHGTVGNLMSEETLLVYLTPEGASAEAGFIIAFSAADRGDLGVVVTPFGSLSFATIKGNWQINATISGTIPTFAIGGPQGFLFPSGFSSGRAGGTIDFTKLPPVAGVPAYLVGSATGTRFQVAQIKTGAHFELSAEIREFGFFLQLIDAAFVVAPGDGDGFLQKILPSGGLNSEFDLKISWSNLAGFHFEGSGSLELRLPIHKTLLNSLTVDSLTAKITGSTQLALEAAITGSLKLGPFTAVFEEVGIAFDIDFPPDKDGNLGALDVAVGFKPPKGLGLTLKSDTITGGGYLSFDKAAGRYVGALELSIKDKIAIKAIGILTTKLPGNQPGYSLLLLITAEFQPIQLGFGFTLNGVGGLIALHRRMNKQALRDGVRNNTLDAILFPKDPVANISTIISALETTFPIEEDRFTFGPMAIIGWGSPTLITAELGLFIEVPDPVEIAIIGTIKALLPNETSPTLQLQINFAGTISFEKKYITFDASLFDSRLLQMTLSGDMAFRLRWGDDPIFVLSVGGFYPGFPVPPLDLPDLRRITINLLGGDNPRLTLSTYFAITSNTAQFGAAVDFYYKVSGKLTIDGNLGFDALFRFTPFHFTCVVKGGLNVNWKGDSILSLWFEGMLDGPNPWQLQGSAGFKILKINYSVSFDKTWGNSVVTALPDTNVLPLLMTALQDKTNWQATLPANVPLLVTVRNFSQSTDVVVHPQGTMAVSQKVVPLNFTIQRFGNTNPITHRRFTLDILPGSSTTPLPKTNLKEYFAPNEFLALSDSQRLTFPSFEKYDSGIQVQNASTALSSGAYYEMFQEYELIYMDQPKRVVRYTAVNQFDNTTQQALCRNNSTGNSPMGVQQKAFSQLAPAQASVQQESFALAKTHDLGIYSSTSTANSEAEAQLMLNDLLASNPELEGKLCVVHAFEIV